MEKTILTERLEYALDESVILQRPFSDRSGDTPKLYSYEFARDTVDLLSRASWWSSSNDCLNLKDLQTTCNKIRNKTLAIEKRLKTITANDILATVGQSFWPNSPLTDDPCPSLNSPNRVNEYREHEYHISSQCSPQSRLHNWLETENTLPAVNNNQNAIASNKDEDVFWDEMKTVGYGRKHNTETVTFNNPFDQRITFDGLHDWFRPNGARRFETEPSPRLDDLRRVRITHFDSYLNDYQKYVRSLYECGRYYSWFCKSDHIEPRVPKAINADCFRYANEDERGLAERVFSTRVKNIWLRDVQPPGVIDTLEHSRRSLERQNPGLQSQSLTSRRYKALHPCPESWKRNRPFPATPKTSSKLTPSVVESNGREMHSAISEEGSPEISKPANAVAPTAVDFDKYERSLIWWRETNSDSNSVYSFLDAFRLLPQESSVAASQLTEATDFDDIYKSITSEATETKGQGDWFKDLMEASGLTQFIDLSKDYTTTDPTESNTSPDFSPYPTIWDRQTLSVTKETCPLPMKSTRSATGGCSSSIAITTTTHSETAPRFSVAEQSGEQSQLFRQNANVLPSQHHQQPSHQQQYQQQSHYHQQQQQQQLPKQQQQYRAHTPNIKGNITEVNVQQLFQAAQAGCQTVISRGMLPYTCFYKQRPAFIQQNPSIIWQPWLNHMTDFRPSSGHCQGRAMPLEPTIPLSLATSGTTTQSTTSPSCSSAILEPAASNTQHRQSPIVWLNKDETRRQACDSAHDRGPDTTHVNSSSLTRNASVCFPVAFNIGPPIPAPLAAPISPACFTARPGIQIALGNNAPPSPLTAPFSAVYRTGFCNVKNVNKNNSGSEVETSDDPVLTDERSILHGVPDLCLQPSLSSMQANIIQIFPTNIIYS